MTLSILGISKIALHTREKLIDVLNSEYFLYSKINGEKLWEFIRKHGIRNILLPAVTIQFASISELFGGSVLVENVFSLSLIHIFFTPKNYFYLLSYNIFFFTSTYLIILEIMVKYKIKDLRDYYEFISKKL